MEFMCRRNHGEANGIMSVMTCCKGMPARIMEAADERKYVACART